LSRCADCKHWIAEAASPRVGFEECTLARSLTMMASPHPESLAVADADGDTPDGTAQRLFTAPTFGCVQWEPK